MSQSREACWHLAPGPWTIRKWISVNWASFFLSPINSHFLAQFLQNSISISQLAFCFFLFLFLTQWHWSQGLFMLSACPAELNPSPPHWHSSFAASHWPFLAFSAHSVFAIFLLVLSKNCTRERNQVLKKEETETAGKPLQEPEAWKRDKGSREELPCSS